MKIGILQTGESPDAIRNDLGDYDELFEQLLAGRGFEFTTYTVFKNQFPDSVAEQQGWLITGSRFGVYEDHDWIPPLEVFLRDAYTQNIPIIGVCFGHQILAQALGGKVEKFSGGWSVGAVTYTDIYDDEIDATLMAWHQDQVTYKPDDARVVGRSDFCENAMLAYGDRAYSVQAHPEFNRDFVQGLMKARGGVLPEGVLENANKTLETPITNHAMADRFEQFFKSSRG